MEVNYVCPSSSLHGLEPFKKRSLESEVCTPRNSKYKKPRKSLFKQTLGTIALLSVLPILTSFVSHPLNAPKDLWSVTRNLEREKPVQNGIYETIKIKDVVTKEKIIQPYLEKGLTDPEIFAKALQEYPEFYRLLVDRWVTKRENDPNLRVGLENAIKRMAPYVAITQEAYAKLGLPTKYALTIPLVESRFQNHEVSSAGAVGGNQIIESTAKRRGGIIIPGKYDGRRNPIISAELTAKEFRANLDMIKELEPRFGKAKHLQLALAAHNSGSLPWNFRHSGEESYIVYLGKILEENPKETIEGGNAYKQLYFLIANAGAEKYLKRNHPEIFETLPSRNTFRVYETPNKPCIYTIEKGDSLWKAAYACVTKNYGTANDVGINRVVNFLLRDGNKKTIHPNDRIIIPSARTLIEIEQRTGMDLRRENPHINPDAELPLKARIIRRV